MSVNGGEQTWKFDQTDLSSVFFLVFLVFSVYSVVLVNNFGVLDDYNFLYNAVNHSNGTVTLLLGAGRPLNAYLLDLGFRLAGSIEGLAYLRGLTLLGFSLLANGLYIVARRHGLSMASSLALAAGVVLLPSFQVYAAWAQHFTTPYAGFLALLAAYLLSPIRHPAESMRLATTCQSAVLLTASVLIYQPIALIFFVGLLISVMTSRQPMSECGVARLLAAGVAFVFAMAAGYVALKVGQHYYPGGSSRYGLVTDLAGKTKWFVTEPLPNALSFFWVPGNDWGVSISILAMAAGYSAYAKRHGLRQGGYVLFISAGCVVASYLPNLATAENWASYRSIGVLSSVLFTILILAAFAPLAKKLCVDGESRPAPLGLVLLAVIILCVSVSAAGRMSRSFVQPNVMEINNLASLLKSRAGAEIDHIFVRPSSWLDSAASPVLYDEFGMQSSLDDHRATVIVDLVRRSLGVLPGARIVPVANDKSLGMTLSSSDVYVDFPALDTAGRFQSTSPRLQ